jgi:hypothetical protein
MMEPRAEVPNNGPNPKLPYLDAIDPSETLCLRALEAGASGVDSVLTIDAPANAGLDLIG